MSGNIMSQYLHDRVSGRVLLFAYFKVEQVIPRVVYHAPVHIPIPSPNEGGPMFPGEDGCHSSEVSEGSV